jgi:hypothetical protein
MGWFRSKRTQQRIHNVVAAWRESAVREIETDNRLFAGFRRKFAEGYGPSGREICKYADILAAAKIENSHSRRESELPSTREQIKLAILEVTELAVANQDSEVTFELLKIAYSSLARFLPESKAGIVTARNLGYLSEDPDHPSLRNSTQADRVEAEVGSEESRLGQEFDQIVAYDRHREARGIGSTPEAEALRETVLAYRESASKGIAIDNAELSECRPRFGEGYGPNGLLVCEYVDVIAKATIENSRSRSVSELPASPEKIKQAIRDVAELAIARQEVGSALEPLQTAYSFLARFLPESQASLVIKYNQACFSEDPNHPDLPRSEEEEAEQIEAEVDAEQDRLGREFDQIAAHATEIGWSTDDEGVDINNREQEALAEATDIVRAFGRFLSKSQPLISDAQLLPYPKSKIAQSYLMYERYLCDVANEYVASQDVEGLKEIDQALGPLRSCRGLVASYSIIEPQDMEDVSYFNSFKSIKDVPKDEADRCFDLKMKYASKGMKETVADES